MDEMLIFLLKRKANLRPLRITTIELGEALGMSQQNASRQLAMIEEAGYIERGKDGIMLTAKATGELESLFSLLRSAFENVRIGIGGQLMSGLGEGKYYLSMEGYRKGISEKLGFLPFPGTLNIRIGKDGLWKKKAVLKMDPIIIPGFKDKDRSYGDLFAYRCKIKGFADDCALIVPLRTHHGEDVIEVVSARSIKKAMKLADGDHVEVIV